MLPDKFKSIHHVVFFMLEIPVPDPAGGSGRADGAGVIPGLRSCGCPRPIGLESLPFAKKQVSRVNLILGWYSKASVTGSRCLTEIDGVFQLLVHLADRATKHCPVVNIDARLEFVSPVASCKVALGPLGLYGLKIHLMGRQPALVTQHTAPWIEGRVMSKSRPTCSCLCPAPEG